MAVIVKGLGYLYMLIGATFLINPALIKKYIAFWLKGSRSFVGAIIAMIFGVFLIVAASDCVIPWPARLLGVLALIKGVVLLAYGPRRLVSKSAAWLDRQGIIIRLMPLIPIGIGVILILSA